MSGFQKKRNLETKPPNILRECHHLCSTNEPKKCFLKKAHSHVVPPIAFHTNKLFRSRPRQRGPYILTVPHSVCIANVTSTIEHNKLGEIGYFLPRKFVVEIINGLWRHLFDSLNKNSTEIHSNGHDNTLNP